MSYAGKFVGQNVGSWLGPVDSDPNALYAGLSGAGAAVGTLTALGQLQAALFGAGDLVAAILAGQGQPEPPIVVGPGIVRNYAMPAPRRRRREEQDEEAVLVAITMH